MLKQSVALLVVVLVVPRGGIGVMTAQISPNLWLEMATAGGWKNHLGKFPHIKLLPPLAELVERLLFGK